VEAEPNAPFVYRHRVRYSEIDAQHHVYFSRYLEIVDAAMIELVRALGWDYEEAVERGFDPVTVHLEVDFHSGARFDELVEIEVWPRRLGESSTELGYRLTGADGRPLADVAVVYVNFDVSTRGKRSIPAAVRERLAELVPPASPEG
jgi:acyl-CoA thioester hydrolase